MEAAMAALQHAGDAPLLCGVARKLLQAGAPCVAAEFQLHAVGEAVVLEQQRSVCSGVAPSSSQYARVLTVGACERGTSCSCKDMKHDSSAACARLRGLCVGWSRMDCGWRHGRCRLAGQRRSAGSHLVPGQVRSPTLLEVQVPGGSSCLSLSQGIDGGTLTRPLIFDPTLMNLNPQGQSPLHTVLPPAAHLPLQPPLAQGG